MKPILIAIAALFVFVNADSALAEVKPGDKSHGKVSNGDCKCKRICRSGRSPGGHPWNLTTAQYTEHCEVRFQMDA
jgi:hypothetical protein